MDVAARRTKRLIVTEPPRHGKSLLISQYFPVWYLGNFPEHRIILTSYEADFASGWGRRARDILEEHGGGLFGINVRQDSSAANRWDLAGHDGGMVTAGAGGPVTGKGGNCILIDDPFKNAQEANSETIRDRVWEWYQSTLYTRLEPDGVLIIIMTRWHEDDLVGRLLNPDYGPVEDWDIINLPAFAEDVDPLGREVGEPLWPERYGKAELLRIKDTVGNYWWNALYQQRPAPPEGNVIQRGWWQYYRQAPSRFDEVIQSWDMAFKDKETSDFVVGQVWGRKGADKYLLDQVRGRMDFPSTVRAVESLSAKWPQARAKLVEDTANGPAVIATLKRTVSGLIPVNPEGGKMARLQAVSPDIEAGNVYIPEPSIASWIHDYVEEFAAFPNGANDDQVDSTSQALLRLGSGRGMAKIYRQKPAGW